MGNCLKKDRGVRVFFLVFLFVARSLSAADPDVEYKLKAEMLERFTLFIEWPEVTGPTFLTCVMGENPFGNQLDTVFRETRVQGKKAEIKNLKQLEGIDSCQILFIPASEQQQLPSILSSISGKPILTVGDT